MGNMGIWQLVIILVIVVLLFGTKRLKGIGSDLGGAIKGFKKAVTDEEKDADFTSQKKVENTTDSSATASAPQSEVKDKS